METVRWRWGEGAKHVGMAGHLREGGLAELVAGVVRYIILVAMVVGVGQLRVRRKSVELVEGLAF